MTTLGFIRSGGLPIILGGLDYYEVFIAPYLAVHYPQVIVDTAAGDAMGPVAIAFPVSGPLTASG